MHSPILENNVYVKGEETIKGNAIHVLAALNKEINATRSYLEFYSIGLKPSLV